MREMVAILRRSPSETVSNCGGILQYLEKVGDNLGNLLFKYAIEMLLSNYDQVNYEDIRQASWINSHCKALILPAANILSYIDDFGDLADLLEGVTLPVLVLGLGVQMPRDGREYILPPGTRKFVDILQHNHAVVGVRGELSLSHAERNGLRDCAITGCPSNLINKDLNLGLRIMNSLKSFMRKDLSDAEICLIAGTIEAETIRAERQLRLAAVLNKFSITFQTNRHLLPSGDGGSEVQRREYLDWERHALMPEMSLKSYMEWHRRARITMYSGQEWINRMSEFDFSVGLRFHGIMASLQGGAIGACIPFDHRTFEMCRTMCVPTLNINELAELQNIDLIGTKVVFDSNLYDYTREALCQTMLELFKLVGLRPSGGYFSTIKK
jgi:hypothetical protein